MFRSKVSPRRAPVRRGRGDRAVFVSTPGHTSAEVSRQSGIDLVLVGGSRIGLEPLLDFVGVVRQSVERALVIGDLPLLSYQASERCAMRDARALIAAGCDAVLCIGGARSAARVAALVRAGVPVMGHLRDRSGSICPRDESPAHDEQGAARLARDAAALEAAGACALLVESASAETAARVRGQVGIPVYGIGPRPPGDGRLIAARALRARVVR